MTNETTAPEETTEEAGRVDAIVITLPRHPTADQIDEIFSLMRMQSSDSSKGIELQDKYSRFDTTFGLKAAAYERLIDYADAL